MAEKDFCEWKEIENGKGELYQVSCLGESSKGINVFKVSKRKGVLLGNMFHTCIYCGRRVKPIFLDE